MSILCIYYHSSTYLQLAHHYKQRNNRTPADTYILTYIYIQGTNEYIACTPCDDANTERMTHNFLYPNNISSCIYFKISQPPTTSQDADANADVGANALLGLMSNLFLAFTPFFAIVIIIGQSVHFRPGRKGSLAHVIVGSHTYSVRATRVQILNFVFTEVGHDTQSLMQMKLQRVWDREGVWDREREGGRDLSS